MFSLFNPPFTGERTTIVLPMFDYLVNQTKHEVSKVTDYYNDNLINAKTTDRLVKLLVQLQTYMDLPKATLLSQTLSESVNLSTAG